MKRIFIILTALFLFVSIVNFILCQNNIRIGRYNLFVFGIFGIYSVWLFVYSKKEGFPKDDSKLPKMMNLEFLRIIFTLIVVWCHFAVNVGLWFASWLGVEFFFVLSGFLFVLTFKPERTYTEFLKDRLIRFMPLVVFLGIIRNLFWKDYLNTISDFFFLTPLGLHKSPSVASGSWYIGILIVVSLFFQYLLKTRKKEDVNLIIGIMAFVSAIILTQFNWGNGVWRTIEPNVIPLSFAMLRGLLGIGVGYFTGLFYLKHKTKPKAKKPPTIIEVTILFFSVVTLLVEKLYPQNPVYILMMFSTLIYLFANNNGVISNFFEKKIFCKLSKYCLSLYLTHFIIAYSVLYPCLKHYPEWIKEHIVPTAILYFICAVILAVFAHYLIEMPATYFLRKYLRQKDI